MKKSILALLSALIVLLSAACNEVHEDTGDTFSGGGSTETDLPAETQPSFNIDSDEVLRVIVFDFGKADCILLSLHGEHMLIDAAYKSDGDEVAASLKALGVTKLKYAVATHPDKDHIGGMADVLKKLDVETLYLSEREGTNDEYKAMMKQANKRGITVVTAQPGDRMQLGGAELLTVAPGRTAMAEADDNNASVVLHMSYRSASMLFMADAKFVSEAEMVSAYGDGLRADVIKIGHHGSSGATSQNLLDTVSPQYAVISGNDRENERLPSEVTLKKLSAAKIEIFGTYKDGDITLYTDGASWRIQTEY